MINEIKETRLVLDSILKMSNIDHREQLLNKFIELFLNKKYECEVGQQAIETENNRWRNDNPKFYHSKEDIDKKNQLIFEKIDLELKRLYDALDFDNESEQNLIIDLALSFGLGAFTINELISYLESTGTIAKK